MRSSAQFAISISRDGDLDIRASQVDLAPPLDGGTDQRTPPHGLFGVELP